MADWQYTPWVIPLVLASALSVWLARYTWGKRQTPGAIPFVILSLGVAWWTLAYVFRLSCATVPAKLFWSKVRYLGIVVVPTAWFAFTLQYTGRGDWLSGKGRWLLPIEPLLVSLAVWTNDWHRLYWSDWGLVNENGLLLWTAEYGPLRWVHVLYSYALLLTALHLLLMTLARSPRAYRGQAGALVVSGLVPLIGDVLSSYGLFHIPLNLSPFSFLIANSTAAWSIAHYRLFDIVPVARREIIEGMSNAVLVLDIHNNLVYINQAALEVLGRSADEVLGKRASDVLAARPDLVSRFRTVTETRAEITWGEGEAQRHYDVHISPLRGRRRRLLGRLVVLYDITERKRIEANLRAQTRLSENLVAITRAAIKYTSLEAALRGVLRMAATITEAEHGSVFLLDEFGNAIDCVRARDDVVLPQQRAIANQVLRDGLAGWVVSHRQAALVEDTEQDERWLPLPDAEYPARSALAVPVVSGGVVFGVITLIHSQPGHFTKDHAYMMLSASDQIALALRNAQMYDEQRRLAARQTTLYEALRTVGQHLDQDTVARAAVDTIARLTDWPVVFILLPDEEYARLEVIAASTPLPEEQGRRLSLSINQGITGRAFRSGAVQYVPDVRQDADYYDSGLEIEISSELAIPLRRGDEMLGVLDIAHDQVNAFDDEDIRLAQSLAEAIALALDNARLYTETRRYASDLGALYTVSRSISRSLILEEVLAETLESALKALDFDAGIITLVDEGSGSLYIAAERGLPADLTERFREAGMDDSLCAYVYDHEEVVTIGDFEEVDQTRFQADRYIENVRALGMRAYSGIPLMHQERPIGTLSLFSRRPRPISPRNQALQVAIGQQIATAVTNARLFRAVADERSRLHALIESSRDGVVLVGTDRRVLVINAQALTFLRLSGQPEDWMGRSVVEVLTLLKLTTPGVAEVIEKEMERVLTGDDSAGEGEYEIPPRTIHWLNLPVRAEETVLGRLMVLHDVTEERSLERLRNDLIHAMVHDLRNPLTAIYGAFSFLDEIVSPTLPPATLELWNVARNSTNGMLAMVNEILDISRLESNQMPVDKTLVALRPLVEEVLGSQMPLAVQKEIRLDNAVEASLPPVWADEGLVGRVLRNLVGNAVKFTPEGGTVTVSARLGDDGQRVVVFVKDTGSGIPPKIRSQLFRRFVTGDQQERGSGLGLAFCKMAIEAHGEHLWVEDTSPAGTTFAFTLPLFHKATERS